MGLYDRDYIRYRPQVRFQNPLGPFWRTSAVLWLIAINVAVFFVQLILKSRGWDLFLYCIPERVIGRFEVWRLLTAAFCHSTGGLGHIFWNMLMLFFFGPPIERLYGRRDFTAFYLTAAVAGNLVYCLVPYLFGGSLYSPVLGASGACTALIVLCALYFPHQIVYLIIFPLPLWVVAAFMVLGDLFGFLSARPGSHIAYVVHLTGAAVGALYRYNDLRLTTILARLRRLAPRRRRKWPEFPVDRRDLRGPSDGIPRFVEDLENQRLDRILEKISRFGRESLTEDEEEFLNRMSDRYRGHH